MVHVFIAYWHEDNDFAYILRQELENAGFEVWMDEDLRAGDDWRTEIDLKIRTAFVLIVIMTPEARKSEYVTYEWACAWGAKKTVIPIMRRQTALHPRLDAFQYIDFTAKDRRAWPWENLIQRLRDVETMNGDGRKVQVAEALSSYLQRIQLALDSHLSQERIEALNTLAQSDDPNARKMLIDQLRHNLRSVRTHAALLLVDLGDYAAGIIPALIKGLEDKDWNIRKTVAIALGKIGDTSAVPALIARLRDENKDVWHAALEALWDIVDANAVPNLIALLNSEEPDKRVSIVVLLTKLGDVSAVPALILRLEDEDSFVRERAAIALGHIGDTSAVPALIARLHDEADMDVCQSVLDALKRIGTPEAIIAVIKWKL